MKLSRLSALFALCAALFPLSVFAQVQAKAHIGFKITIPKVLFVKSYNVPVVVTLGDEDIARGYVDVAAEYTVRSNIGNGFLFTSTLSNNAAFDFFEVLGSGSGKITQTSLSMMTRGLPNMEISFSIPYRLWINRTSASVGTYSWPVSVTLFSK